MALAELDFKITFVGFFYQISNLLEYVAENHPDCFVNPRGGWFSHVRGCNSYGLITDDLLNRDLNNLDWVVHDDRYIYEPDEEFDRFVIQIDKLEYGFYYKNDNLQSVYEDIKEAFPDVLIEWNITGNVCGEGFSQSLSSLPELETDVGEVIKVNRFVHEVNNAIRKSTQSDAPATPDCSTTSEEDNPQQIEWSLFEKTETVVDAHPSDTSSSS